MKLRTSAYALFFLLTLASCDKEESNTPTEDVIDIAFEQTIASGLKLNGQIVTVVETNDSFKQISHITDAVNLPSGLYDIVEFTIAVPVNDQVSVAPTSINGRTSTEDLTHEDIHMIDRTFEGRVEYPDGIHRNVYTFAFDLTTTDPRLRAQNLFIIDFDIRFEYTNIGTGEMEYELVVDYGLLVENSEDLGGEAIFWMRYDSSCYTIDLNVNGVGNFTMYANHLYEPECNYTSSGGKIDDLDAGVYQYTASCDTQNWAGSFTVLDGECTKIELEDNGSTGRSDILFYVLGNYPVQDCYRLRVKLEYDDDPSQYLVREINNPTQQMPQGCNDEDLGAFFNSMYPRGYKLTTSCVGAAYERIQYFTLDPDICLLYRVGQ